MPLFKRSSSILCITVLAGLAQGLAAPDAHAQARSRERASFDVVTGRNLLNYPPHRAVDVRHMRLSVTIPDMNTRVMECTETLTLTPILEECSSFTLNGALLDIQSATLPGRTVTHTANPGDETITFTVDPPLRRGQSVDLAIAYRVTNPPEGLIWTVESPARPGVAPQIHSQGQSECNRFWFIGHDFPNARMTSELIANVPRGYRVISNGKLISHDRKEAQRETYHWRIDRAHPAYLVSMIVGQFDTQDVGTSSLPMPVYVPPGDATRIKGTFGRTPKMIDLFARVTDEPYPWPQYAQTSVRNFEWGGMENTSATTLFETIALDKTALLDGDQDDLIAHELAHQWFGDLLTCKSWEHVWLNEGFATYFEKVWAQYRDSALPSRGRGVEGLEGDLDAYQALIWEDMQATIKTDRADAPYQPAMASKQYAHPDEVFDREANPYPKGSAVLHMLRERLGDEVFWRAVAAYVDEYKDKPVETFQFREVFERVNGTSLQRFFDQWVFRPGVPRITATPAWDDASKTLTVAFEQTQTINGFNPAFDLSIPVWIKVAGETSPRNATAAFDTRTGSVSIPLPREPEMIAIDPRMTTLADIVVHQPIARTIAQMTGGPTLASRILATHTLGRVETDHAAAVAALDTIARDNKAHRSVRTQAARSLARIAHPGPWESGASDSTPNHASGTASPEALAALIALASTRSSDPRLDRVIIEEAAQAAAPADATTRSALAAGLVQRFNADTSYAVRAAAIRGLGTLHADEHREIVLTALNVDSQHDQIRCAAVEALAAMDRPTALQPVLDSTLPDRSSSLRAAATTALGDLAHHDLATAIARLEMLLSDPEPKTATAAGEALASVHDPRAVAALERHAQSARGRTARHNAQKWLNSQSEASAQ